MEMVIWCNSNQGNTCWEALGETVTPINKKHKEKTWPLWSVLDEDAMLGASAANLQLGGREKPGGNAKELEKKVDRYLVNDKIIMS